MQCNAMQYELIRKKIIIAITITYTLSGAVRKSVYCWIREKGGGMDGYFSKDHSTLLRYEYMNTLCIHPSMHTKPPTS